MLVTTCLHEFSAKEALVFGNATHRFQHVADQVARFTSEFESHGVKRGAVIAIEGPTSPLTMAALLAAFSYGAIAVPMTRLPVTQREEFLRTAEAEWFVSVVGDDDFPVPRRLPTTASHALYRALWADCHPGLVLFSSGTTGRAKASVLDVSKLLKRYDGARVPKRILAFLNLDHIGGINTLLHTVCSGGTLIAGQDRTPTAVFEAIQKHGAQVLPTTPTFLNMVVVSRMWEKFATPSLELITYGTEPMPQRTLDVLKHALPHVKLKQTYGLSELGILPTRSKDDGSLWMKLGGPGFDYKIVDHVLWVRSEMAMLGYLNAQSRFDAQGYFDTQDDVEQDGEYIRVLGRRSEIINVGGEKVYPAEVENVLLELNNIEAATVSGKPSHVTGMVVKAVVRLMHEEDIESLTKRILEHCAQRLEPYKAPMFIEVSDKELHSERFKKVRSAI